MRGNRERNEMTVRLSRRNGAMLAAACFLSACGAAPDDDVSDSPGYVRTHDIMELMTIVVQPQADRFWQSAGSISDETGLHDLTPSTDEAWQATRTAAATVAEMGNLLQTPIYAAGRGKDWKQFSRSLAEVGMQAEKAAVDRDAAAILQVGGTLYNVCQACHQVYGTDAIAGSGAQ